MTKNRRSFAHIVFCKDRLEGRSLLRYTFLGNLQPTKYKGDALLLVLAYTFLAGITAWSAKTVREALVDINEAEDNACEAGPLFPIKLDKYDIPWANIVDPVERRRVFDQYMQDRAKSQMN